MYGYLFTTEGPLILACKTVIRNYIQIKKGIFFVHYSFVVEHQTPKTFKSYYYYCCFQSY